MPPRRRSSALMESVSSDDEFADAASTDECDVDTNAGPSPRDDSTLGVAAAAAAAAAAASEEASDEGEDDGDESSDDDDEDESVEDETGGDFDDGTTDPGDGMEEEESGGGDDVRRPVSIQEFLAWRLLGRVPESVRGREDTRRRYLTYEEAEPQSLPRGSLWQQISLATGPAPPRRRNASGHFDSCLDVSADASLQSCRSAKFGEQTRQRVLAAVRADPRAAAAVSYLGPPGTADTASAASTSAAAAATAAAAAAAAAGPSTSTSSGRPSPAPSPNPSPSYGTGPKTRAAARAAAAAATAATAAAAAAAAASPPFPAIGSGGSGGGGGGGGAAAAAAGCALSAIPPGFLTGIPSVPSPRMVLRREQGEAAGVAGGWSAAQRRHMTCTSALPRYPHSVVDAMDSRAYIGQFSDNGQFFVAAFQDRRVRLYDVERGWRLRKDITTRMCRWTITDTSVSPDQRFVLYSSIIPIVHLVEVGSSYDCVDSIANITQVHEPLNFDDSTGGPNGGDFRLGRSFGIWSVQWSGDGREIVAGTNDQSVVVLDVETRRVVARAEGHDDDVNAVTYADSSPNIIISGSDDTFIKVWDRRTMPSTAATEGASGGTGGTAARTPKPVGVLVGHTEGLTHLHSRGDGRHVLSNAKDQTAKLWDIRMVQAGGSLRDVSSAHRLSRQQVPQFNWDYRWQEYPAAGRVVRHPHDSSIQTYRGHSVQHTLIRAYFSPMHTTGQRFIYTGSVDGGVHVYDVVSGQEVEGSPFRLHRKLVRDVSWHPFEPVMATVSWDGTVARWDAVPPPRGSRGPEVPGHDAYNDSY